MMSNTSLIALADHLAAGHAGRQERLLLKLWLEHPTEGLSDREAERLSGIRANTISARRNGLRVRWYIEKLPLAFTNAERPCTVTGRRVKAWRIIRGEVAQHEFGF